MMARLSKRQRAILDAKEAAAAEAEPAGQDGQPLATLGPAVEDDDDAGDDVSLSQALAPQKKRKVGTETAPLIEEDLEHTGKELSGKWSALKTCFAKFKLEMEKSGNQGDDVLLEKASKVEQFMWESYDKNAAFVAAIARDLPPHASREAGSTAEIASQVLQRQL